MLYLDKKNISCLQWSNNEHNPKLHGWKEICWCLIIWLNNCWVEWVFLIHAIASISLHLYPVSALSIFKLTLTFISRRAYTLTCYNYSKLLFKYKIWTKKTKQKQNTNPTIWVRTFTLVQIFFQSLTRKHWWIPLVIQWNDVLTIHLVYNFFRIQ